MISDETAAALREPFPAGEVGKLPRVTCPDCRSKDTTCQRHRRSRCSGCGSFVSTDHIHLDYVGHAEVTDRLLQVDPEWNWEPMGWDATGLPAFDRLGGLWIRLTVSGMTRPGYGHADNMTGGDAVKEVIGDALRNAAMRFGIGLDLWRRSELADDAPEEVHQPATGSQLRGEIAELAKSKGYSLSQVEDDFTTAMNGADITTAGVPELAEYRDRLKGYPDVGQ